MAPMVPHATLVMGAADEPWRINTSALERPLDVPWHVHDLTPAAAPPVSAVAPPPGLESHTSQTDPSTATIEGEWAKSVLQSAPYLSAEQLREAVSILDGALANAQLCASLDASDEAAGLQQRQQIREEQGRLFSQLQLLRLSGAAPTLLGGSVPTSRTTPPGFDALSAPVKKAAPMAPTKSASGAWQQPGQQERKYGKVQAQRPQVANMPQQKQSFDGSDKAGARSTQTLSSSLQVLSKEDPDCLFIVRRINKLGFKASRTLKQFFSAQGQVVRVLVAHSTVRQQSEQQCGQVVRRRPSSLGFVQMQNAEAVKRVLANGEEQLVKGAVIRVQKFEHKSVPTCEEDQLEDGQDEVSDETFEWQRFISSGSLASCTTTASLGSSAGLSGEHPYF